MFRLQSLASKLIITAVAASAIILAATPTSTFAASAQPYIQINNGSPIRMNKGQPYQVVVQFGNRGSALVKNTFVDCSVYGNGWIDSNNVQGGPFAHSFTTGDEVYFGVQDDAKSTEYNFDKLTINPGQNYNVAFTLWANPPASNNDYTTLACSINSNGNEVMTTMEVPVVVLP